MKEINSLYPKATHYCWAYRFATNPVLEHCSDAGEPAGTAGRPILGALKKNNLLNILAVVTRYYGGIKLGVKGLINAYGESTSHAVAEAQIITDEPQALVRFTINYELYNTFLARIKTITDTSNIEASFTEHISGEFQIAAALMDPLKALLDTLSPSGGGITYTFEDFEN